MRLCHVTIQTEAFEDEIKFFEQYAGLTIQRDMRGLGRNLVFLADAKDGAEIEIIERQGAHDSGNKNLSIGFIADDLDALRSELAKDGFKPSDIVSPAPSVRFFFVRDPAGVNIQFM